MTIIRLMVASTTQPLRVLVGDRWRSTIATRSPTFSRLMSSPAPTVSPQACLCRVANSDREKQTPWYQRLISSLHGAVSLPRKTKCDLDEENASTHGQRTETTAKPNSRSPADLFIGQPAVLESTQSDVIPSW